MWMAGISNAQVVSAHIMDEQSNEPIPFANIFIENSTIGTQSDLDGHFELDLKEVNNAQIAISHLNYELVTLNVDEVKDTVYLSARSIVIEGLSISSKGKDRLRSKRLKRFEDSFLGANRDRKKVYLTNSDQILFDEKRGILYAYSDHPVKVYNEHLGYEIEFHIERFELNYEEELLYKGSIFFKSLDGTRKQTARYNKNRKRTFENSSQRFFADLLTNDFDRDVYQIGYGDVSWKGELQDIFFIDSIHVEYVRKGIFSLNALKPLVVVHNDINLDSHADSNLSNHLKLKNTKKRKLNKASSIFKAKKGVIHINRYGQILNGLEVEELGYWAVARMDKMLPLDYKND